MADAVNFVPSPITFTCKSGSDLSFSITLPYNTTGGTHELLIAATPDGTSIMTLGEGTGLTVTPGATSTVAVLVPRAFMATQSAKQLSFDYNLTMGGIKQTKVTGTIVVKTSIQP